MKFLTFFVGLCLSTAVAASGFNADPYVGLEGKLRYNRFESDKGSHALAKAFPEVGFLAGVRLGDFFGLEAGAHVGKSKKHKDSLVRCKMSGFKVTAHGYVPLFDELEFIGGVGVSKLRSVFQAIGDDSFKISKSNALLHGLGGLQYKLFDNLSLRSTLSYEHTKKLRIENDDFEIKPKNHFNLNFGLLYTF